MNILITGASGFIGSHLTNRLKSHNIFITSRKNENEITGNIVAESFQDIDFSQLPKLDILFHQAAITDTLVHTKNVMQVNCYDALELFNKALDKGCKKIVYASSCAVYGDVTPPFKEAGPYNPLNIYAESKLELDRMVNSDKIIGLRYSNVYGRGEYHKKHYASMVSKLIKQVKLKETPKLFKWGEQKRDFVYIEDVVEMNIKAAESGLCGVFNAGSGVARSFNEIIDILGVKAEYIDNPYKGYQTFTECDMAKTKQFYTPQWSLEKGIADIYKYDEF